jgi:hypothetical protein
MFIFQKLFMFFKTKFKIKTYIQNNNYFKTKNRQYSFVFVKVVVLVVRHVPTHLFFYSVANPLGRYQTSFLYSHACRVMHPEG